MSDCCHPFTGACQQNIGCPVRETPFPSLDLPAPMRCKKSKQPCATPWTCAPGCRLVTANSDGSSPDTKRKRWPGRLVCALTLMSIACAVITVYLKS